MKTSITTIYLTTLLFLSTTPCFSISITLPLIPLKSDFSLKNDSLLIEAIFDEANDIEELFSLIILQNGEIISEEYFHGNKKGDLNNTQSITKSIMSLLIGIAIEKGFIECKTERISKFIKMYHDSANSITIENLLTMTSGFNWDENKDFVPWITAKSQVEFILNRELEHESGTIFEYNSAAAHLLSVIIERTCGVETRWFAIQNLFAPIGIEKINWPRDSESYSHGSTGLALSPNDMVKIGQLILNSGMFNGEQLVNSKWINKITTRHNYVKSEWGELEDIWYGCLWWTANMKDYAAHFAWGYAGQFIFVIPELNAVIATTSKWRVDAYNASSTEEEIIDLIADYIIPLLEEKEN